MKRNRYLLLLLFGAVILTGACVIANACDWWVVQGIIDWTSLPDRPDPNTNAIYSIYKKGWEWHTPDGNGDLKYYTVADGDIFLPRPEQIDAQIPFGVLTGAVMLKKGEAAQVPDKPDWYEVWTWEDTNNDGTADKDDREQNWEPLIHKAPPEKANEAIDLIKDTRKLLAGKTYLLLIRTGFEATSGTNLRFSGEVAFSWPNVAIETWADECEEGWSDKGDKRFKKNWSAAVEDREVLHIRVNNPPAKPVVP